MRPDYSFCRRPVTVYNPVWDAAGALHLRRTVLPRAFLAPGRRFGMGSAYAGSGLTGATSREEFTLVVPLEERVALAGDGTGGLGGAGDAGSIDCANGTGDLGGAQTALFAAGCGWRFVSPAAFEALADKRGHFTLARGTRVFDGTGPVVKGDEAWGRFIPALVDGVYEIGRVALRRGTDGAVCHVEGGA